MTQHQDQDVFPTCRNCGSALRHDFVDLGMTPLCESFLEPTQLNAMESFYPLHVYVCGKCFLVQLEEYVSPESIFTEYAYFSSYSNAWLKHAQQYVDMAIQRFGLTGESQVVELASNDGYLLQYFVEREIPVLGIEPAANVAKAAEQRNVPTLVKFFGRETARQQREQDKSADLIIGNNVLAQVPDLHDFVGGMKILLKPEGVITLEFPHLLQLMDQNQFDTIYHEHFSYFSASAVDRIMQQHGLRFFDVEELWTHGGSLRVFVAHDENVAVKRTNRLNELLERERELGLLELETYIKFSVNVAATKRKLLKFLIEVKDAGKSVVGYGAAGKGNTLLNYCGIGTDFIDYIVDRNPYKHGRYTPGTHIPILEPDAIMRTKPQYILILPWNLKAEIMEQLSPVREWGAQFVVPIPEVRVYS